MNSHRMFELAQALAVAKSRQDVPAALQLLHVDMLLESPAFGTMARGIAENEKVLTRFFFQTTTSSCKVTPAITTR